MAGHDLLLSSAHAFSGFMNLNTIGGSMLRRGWMHGEKEYVRRTGRLGIAGVARWPERSNTLLALQSLFIPSPSCHPSSDSCYHTLHMPQILAEDSSSTRSFF